MPCCSSGRDTKSNASTLNTSFTPVPSSTIPVVAATCGPCRSTINNNKRIILHHSHLGVSMESFGVKSSLDSFGNAAARPGPGQLPGKPWNTGIRSIHYTIISGKNDLLVAIIDGS